MALAQQAEQFRRWEQESTESRAQVDGKLLAAEERGAALEGKLRRQLLLAHRLEYERQEMQARLGGADSALVEASTQLQAERAANQAAENLAQHQLQLSHDVAFAATRKFVSVSACREVAVGHGVPSPFYAAAAVPPLFF